MLAGLAIDLGGFVCARIELGLSWEAYPPMLNALLTLLTAAFVMLSVRYGRVTPK